MEKVKQANGGSSRNLLMHLGESSAADHTVVNVALHMQPEDSSGASDEETATESEAPEQDNASASDATDSSGDEAQATDNMDDVAEKTAETVNGDEKQRTKLSAEEAASTSGDVPQKNALFEAYMTGLSNWQDGFRGQDVVSAVCAKLQTSKACVERIGCEWSETRERCEDASQWHCTTKKTVTDCVAQRELSPGYPGNNPGTMALPVRADKLCGKMLFGQKKKVFKQCKYGFRSKHSCTSDADCPGSECAEYSSVDGCATALRMQCGSMGWQQLTSSIT